MFDRDKMRKSGLDSDFEQRVDDFLRSSIEVDFNNTLFFQLNRCFLALSMGDIGMIKFTVDAFGDALTIQYDQEYKKDIQDAMKIKDAEMRKKMQRYEEAEGYSPGTFEEGMISNDCLLNYYRKKFSALIRLCHRENIFGKKPFESEA